MNISIYPYFISFIISFSMFSNFNFADDLNPPAWRTDINNLPPQATYQVWDFTQQGPPAVGQQPLQATVGSGNYTGSVINPPMIYNVDVRNTTTSISLFIPNFQDSGTETLLRIQVTEMPPQGSHNGATVLSVTDAVNLTPATLVSSTRENSNGYHYEDWMFSSNPTGENIVISFPGTPEQIVIDTITPLPEPGTWLLLGSALAWGGIARARKHLAFFA